MKPSGNLPGLLPGFAAFVAVILPTVAFGAPGAMLPWTTYEAELAQTNGNVIAPSDVAFTPVFEASGRSCVQLDSTSEFVEIKAKSDANGIVFRYSIPDSKDGRGLDATLGLYINDQLKTRLNLTSKLTHLYGPYPFNNDPSAGSPRNFWDEVRVMPGEIRAGDVIRIQKDADDSASEYLIDFIDLETVPAPIEQPADSLSITEFGASANDSSDDRPACLKTIDAAKAQKKSVWIPAGQFVIQGAIDVSDITIQGAGMWHSTLIGVDDYKPENRIAFYGRGSNITLSDFAIIGKLNYRNDSEPNDGIGESFGTGSKIRNLWVEHTKAGAWLVNSDGLTIEGCRFRNNIADGINLCVGMKNTTVKNCTARGTGDDCFAMWPATYAESNYSHGNNRYLNCTAQLPFLAQAFSIYGGDSNSVEDCLAIDIPYGAGLYASTTFPTESGFQGTTIYRNNKVIRAGGTEGAIGTVANRIDLVGVRFEAIELIDSRNDGIKFISLNQRVLKDATFDRIKIENAGTSGNGHAIVEADGAVGSATLSNITISNTKNPWQDNAPAFELIFGEGNSGLKANEQSSATPSCCDTVSRGAHIAK